MGGCVLESNQLTNLFPDEDSGSDELLQTGTILENRYQIEGVIGTGGMSTVYSARDLRFSVVKPVAVKEMINRARDDMLRESAVIMFEREANVLASLQHPSIPKIHDYFTIGSQSYLVMELIPGQNLEKIIDQTQGFIPESQVISWTIELCDVLEYLHNQKPQPTVFRDMKPANIMITPDHRLVLVDFGIAKVFQGGQKGTMIGTEGYSPPEQYRGEATPSVDIYALGATLHHILTRKDPRIETPFTFSERPIREINPNVSIELEDIVITAVQYDPDDRFKDIFTMKMALKKLARKTGILPMYGVTQKLNVNQSIKPIWVFECEDEVRGTATYHEGVIYVGAYDHNLYALNAATGDFIWKYATDGGIVGKPAIFEKNIYIGSEDERLHVISPKSALPLWTYYAEGPIRSSPYIADRHVFIGSDDAYLHILNATTGRRASRIDLGAPVRSTPIVANELIYIGVENGEFFCFDFHGKIRWRVRAKRAVTSSPVLSNNVIYYGSVDGTLYAVDAKTGWGIWRFRMNRGTISSPCILDNTVFIGSADGNIYAIDTRSSKEIWRYVTEDQVSSSPTIYNDALYIGGVDGNVYCINHQSGHLRWKFETGGAVVSSPIIHNDIVYIGSTDHHIYALPV